MIHQGYAPEPLKSGSCCSNSRFALSPPSLLTALWEVSQMVLTGAAAALCSAQHRTTEDDFVKLPPLQARVGMLKCLLAQGKGCPAIRILPHSMG